MDETTEDMMELTAEQKDAALASIIDAYCLTDDEVQVLQDSGQFDTMLIAETYGDHMLVGNIIDRFV